MKIKQDDLGWDEDNKVLVPGFGFYPPRVIELLQNITEVISFVLIDTIVAIKYCRYKSLSSFSVFTVFWYL